MCCPPRPEEREPGEEGERQEPGDLRRYLAVKEAPQARAVAERTTAAHAPDLVARDPTEAVVPEQELDDAVRLLAADERPRIGRPQLDERDVPAADHDRHGRGDYLDDTATD